MLKMNFYKEGMLITDINRLNHINEQLKLLEKEKERLTLNIIRALEHDKEGEKSYDTSIHRITCKTPMNYSLSKELYEANKEALSCFNPIKESKSYSVDKKLCEHYMLNAPLEIKSILRDLIIKKPAKPSVSIKVIGE